MRDHQDLTGATFGRLIVMAVELKNGRPVCLCRCECGSSKVVHGRDLRSGDTKSCGCLKREANKARFETHGASETPTFKTWIGMKNRCENPNGQDWASYGGRGILVCDRWRNSFEAFLADMGERPSARHSIDRIDNDGNYEPGNCRWAIPVEQCRNRSSNRILSFDGKSQPVCAWAEEMKIPVKSLYWRLSKGWSPERALKTPVACKQGPNPPSVKE